MEERGGVGRVEGGKASFAKFRTCGLNYSLKRKRVLGGVGGGPGMGLDILRPWKSWRMDKEFENVESFANIAGGNMLKMHHFNKHRAYIEKLSILFQTVKKIPSVKVVMDYIESFFF